jgi:hypothetical protein
VTADGSATAGSDYLSTSGTLTFDPGQTSKAASVLINGDVSFEPNETFVVNLSNPVNATIIDAQATGTILNDDAQGGFIALSQSSYAAGEGDGAFNITVNRTNDVSGPATVDYATEHVFGSDAAPCSNINHFASSRCDYTPAIATLRFAAGESSKIINVLISQDNYVEGPEPLILKLSNPTGGAVFGTPTTATLTIIDDPTEPTANPVDDAEVFVRQTYHDFLSREPDPAGLAFWKNQITECQQPGATCDPVARRINVSAAFFLSIEFQQTGYLVERLYKATFGDVTGHSDFGSSHDISAPWVRFEDFLPDTQQIGQGVIVGQSGWEQQLENNKQAFVNAFVRRGAFLIAFPNQPTPMTPTEFVDKMNANAGGVLSPSERATAISSFGGAANSSSFTARAQVLRQVAEDSDLNSAEFNRAFVLMQFFGYLRRNPNDFPDSNYTGYDFWLTKLNQFGGNFVNAEMVKAFINSGEYRQRFGQ